mgnify:CR=1 FL=1
MTPMKVLFLQGHPSFFSRDLGQELARRGHTVRHVTLNVGDWLFWRGAGAICYRGSLQDWEAWLDRLVVTEAIDLLVYFADRHPYHVVAQRVARRRGITPLSYELGYLRPDWITVELGGQSVHSHFPDRLEVIRAHAATLPTPDMRPRYSHPYWQEALAEVAYHLGNAIFRPFFPHFVSDRAHHPIVEYLSYIPRNLRAARNARHANAVIRERLVEADPFFVLALQMEDDYQIRANSRYGGLRPVLQEVIASFAADAPGNSHLVVKLHPMDNGLTDWRAVTLSLAAKAGLADRVDFIDGGDLRALLGGAMGCIVVNSTVGLHALQVGCPVKCLGIATYDIPGVTHQGPLEGFWSTPNRPDPADVACLVRFLAATIQVRGDFYSPQGRASAVAGTVALIESGAVTNYPGQEGLPPRVAEARRHGVSVDPW